MQLLGRLPGLGRLVEGPVGGGLEDAREGVRLEGRQALEVALVAVAVGAEWDLLLLVVAAVPQGRRVVELQDVVVVVAGVAALRAAVPVLGEDALALGFGGAAALVLDQGHDDGVRVHG